MAQIPSQIEHQQLQALCPADQADPAQPIARQAQPVAQQPRPVARQAPPVPQQAPPVAQQPLPVAQQQPPVAQQVPPVARQAQPVAQQAQPVAPQAQPVPQQPQPVAQQLGPQLVLAVQQPPQAACNVPGQTVVTVAQLKQELDDLKRASAANSVACALTDLQQELSKPPHLFDQYKALAGLESLVDMAREKADAHTRRFGTSLRQCRPLLGNRHFQNILLKLVGSK